MENTYDFEELKQLALNKVRKGETLTETNVNFMLVRAFRLGRNAEKNKEGVK